MLKLTRGAYDHILGHCHHAYPKEACGILAGRGEQPLPADDERLVVEVYPMRNVEDSPIGYSMDPREQLALEKQLRARRQRMLGIYHSHTASDAYPSSVDVSLALSPDISYALVSLKDRQRPQLKSYRIDGTHVTPEEVWVEAAGGATPIGSGGWAQV